MVNGVRRLELLLLVSLLLAAVAVGGTIVTGPRWPPVLWSQAPTNEGHSPAPVLPQWMRSVVAAATSPSLALRAVTWAGLVLPLSLPLAVAILLGHSRMERAHRRALHGALAARMPSRLVSHGSPCDGTLRSRAPLKPQHTPPTSAVRSASNISSHVREAPGKLHTHTTASQRRSGGMGTRLHMPGAVWRSLFGRRAPREPTVKGQLPPATPPRRPKLHRVIPRPRLPGIMAAADGQPKLPGVVAAADGQRPGRHSAEQPQANRPEAQLGAAAETLRELRPPGSVPQPAARSPQPAATPDEVSDTQPDGAHKLEQGNRMRSPAAPGRPFGWTDEDQPPAPLERMYAAQDASDQQADGDEDPAAAPHHVAPPLLEDQVLCVMNVLTHVMEGQDCRSAVVAVDTVPGRTEVILDAADDADARLDAVARELSDTVAGWYCRWTRPVLAATTPPALAAPTPPYPLLVPLLRTGKQRERIRYVPLGSWRHLALYGQHAVAAAHQLVCTICAQQRPDDVALAFVDPMDLLATFYRRAPHTTPVAAHDASSAIGELVAALKRQPVATLRPLVAVVVEPDDAMLAVLDSLLVRMRLLPTAPLHLVVVQQTLHSAGQAVYAALPALVTAGGNGPPAWLPHIAAWPKGRHAVLAIHGIRSVGEALLADDIDAVRLLDTMRDVPLSSVPTLLSSAAMDPQNALISTDAPVNDPRTQREPADETEAHSPRTAPDAIGVPGAATAPGQPVNGFHPRHATLPSLAVDGGTPLPHHANGRFTAGLPLHDPPGKGSEAVDEATTERDDGAASMSPTTDLPPSALAALEDAMELGGQPPSAAHNAGLPPTRAAATENGAVGDAGRGIGSGFMLEQGAAPPTPAAAPEDDANAGETAWPDGPAPLTGRDLGELLYLMVTTPQLIDGQGAGLTKGRVKAFLQAYRGNDTLAKQLMLWFDEAGVIHSVRQDLRWREPRPLVSIDLRRIAAALAQTPYPDGATAVAAFEQAQR